MFPKKNHNLQENIKQLIDLFSISINECYDQAYYLHELYHNNIDVLQILGACNSRLSNYERAIEIYNICLKHQPNNIAYKNNLAWNLINIKKYKQAIQLFQQISNLYNNPTIFLNIALVYEQTGFQSQQDVNNVLAKIQQYKKIYPYYQKDKGLIHTFYMSQEKIYVRGTSQFNEQLIDLLKKMQKLQIQPDRLSQMIYEIKNMFIKVKQRQIVTKKYGFPLPKQLLIYMKAFTLFKTYIVDNYQHYMRKCMYTQIKNSVRQLNQVLPQQITQNVSIEVLIQAIILPFQDALQHQSQKILYLKQKFEHNKQIQSQQINNNNNDNNKIFVRKPSNFYSQFFNRLDDVEQFKRKNKICDELIIQKGSQIPLIVILSVQSIDGQKRNKSFVSYYNRYKIRNNNQNFKMDNQIADKISLLPKKLKNQLFVFFYSLNLLMKFYYYYKNDYLYKFEGEIKIITLDQFMELVFPTIQAIVQQLDINMKNIGLICSQIHYGMKRFLIQTTPPQDYGKLIKKLLMQVERIFSQQQNPISDLIFEITHPKNQIYLKRLTSQNVSKNKSQKFFQNYFNHKMNIQHQLYAYQYKYQQFTIEEERVISNSIVLLLTLIFNKKVQNLNENILIQALVECFYESKDHQAFRFQLIAKYYNAKHKISFLQKAKHKIKKLLKKVF